MHDEPVRPVPDDEHAGIATETFRMLSDPTRVKILWALFEGESSVNVLAELVGAAPTAVSQHLSKLRLAGLVESRREGTFAYYSATDSHVHRLLAEALSHAEHVTGAAAGEDPHSYGTRTADPGASRDPQLTTSRREPRKP
ncbi:ArsR/SmtB family transcription factor [Saccharomonospora sp. CUA-673]|uniref:ArsR/SmtB family transcription factor n=1 Tax=Saccharomonospora sp. CUA-673 TaxID=1904969 RepID=UPI003516FF73